MKNCFKKAVSGILAAAMLFSSFTVSSVSAAPSFSKVGGWNETIYAELSGVTDADVTGVSYSGTMSGSLTGEDLEYLVRDKSGGVRIDIPGLAAGTYTLNVTTTSGTVTQSNIVVNEYDRSGYAHYNYTDGVGAYNDDGTLKDNAIVLYVTEENKNTVTLSYGGKTVSGIGNILNSKGALPNVSDTGAVRSDVINTNQEILKDLGNNNIPLVVRIIGTVRGGDANTSDNPPAVNIEGLTAYGSFDYGGTDEDDGMMARIQNAKNITIEGIGDDASMDGWGIHFMCGTAAYAAGLGKSCEVRNIYFQNYPEDAFGAEGVQSGSTLTAPVERIWIHNNSFGPGYCKNPTESDKAEGDGSCDFKRGQYYTMSYNKYWDCHKTNLVGSSDTSLQYFMTMHHNYYTNCQARGPLARQGNIHMYNNVYVGQTDYAMNPRANAYIFAEYNIFERCKNPVTLASGGVLGSLNNIYYSCSGDMSGVEMTSKNDTVANANKYGDFVTNSSYSYIPSDDYLLQTEATDIKSYTIANAGVMNYTEPEDVNTSVTTNVPTASVQLPYDQELNKTYITSTGTTVQDNIIFNPSKTPAVDSLTLRAEGIVFNVAQEVDITVTEISGTYSPQLCSDSGVVYLTGSGTVTVPAGTYVIQSNVYDPGTAAYKECKISHLKIVAHDSSIIVEGTTITTEATTEATTQATTEAETSTEAITTTPVEDVNISAGTVNAKVGDTITVPVKVTGLSSLSNYDIDVAYDTTLLTATGVTGAADTAVSNIANGVVSVAYANLNAGNDESLASDTLFNITFTVLKAGTANVTLTVNELCQNGNDVTFTSSNGTVTISEDVPPTGIRGDVNKDGKVDATDAAIVLRIASGIITDTTPYDMVAADCNVEGGDGKVDVLDAVWILSDKTTPEETTEATTEAPISGVITADYELTPANLANNEYFAQTGDFSASTTSRIRINSDNSLTFTVAPGASVYVTAAHASTSTAGTRTLLLKDANGTTVGSHGYEMGVAASENLIASNLNGTYTLTADNHINVTSIRVVFETVVPDITTVATTTVTTTEATTETTTAAPVDGNVINNSMTISRGTNDSYVTVNNDKNTSGAWKIDKYNSSSAPGWIEFTLGDTANVAITTGGEKLLYISKEVGDTEGTLYTIDPGTTEDNVTLAAGTYYIFNTAGNQTISQIVVTMGGEIPVVTTVAEQTTQATTASSGSDGTTETTTVNLSGAINIAAGDAATLESALKSATAGDVINLAAGDYAMSSAGVKLSKTATAANPITITCSNGYATLDFANTSGSTRGVTVSGDYYNLSNLVVKNSADNGMYITGDHVNVENCVLEANGDTGLQISAGGSNVLVKNCTSFNNIQPENADGFAAKLGVGENVVFDGCISYCNSDDGWDLYSKSGSQQNKYPITLRNCIAFNNGFLTDGTIEPSGDRNGFKLGGLGYSTANVVENCIAFGNGACGFTDNNNPGLAVLKNCTGYKNAQTDTKKHNFSVYRATENLTMTNCLSYVLNADTNGGMDRFQGTSGSTTYNANATVINSVIGSANKYYKVANGKITNNTDAQTVGTEVTISDSDFESMTLPYTDLSKVHEQMRNADGSIKLNGFLQPKAGTVIEGMGASFN